jgi:hypothetical protein
MGNLITRKVNINLTTLVIIGVLFLVIIGGGSMYYKNRIDGLKADVENQIKLKNALVDTVKFYVNARDELVAEKLTLQGTLKEVKNENNKLSENQRELFKRIDAIEKNGQVIEAALAKTNIKLDSIKSTNYKIDTTKNSVQFIDSLVNKKTNDIDVKYDIEIRNVKPLVGGVFPVLYINNLEMKNKQFIEFHWKDEKKIGYPVSFSMSNSNPYFKTSDIDSYIIPEVVQDELRPKFFKRVALFFKKTGKVIVVPLAIAGGFLLNSIVK